MSDYQLRCGAWVCVVDGDLAPCPDPYCRICRDFDGEVRDPSTEELEGRG